MEKYNNFEQAVEKAVARFKSWDKTKQIKLVSHLDADGISASAILTNLFDLENRKYSISILQQLTKEDIIELSKEDCDYFIFSDLGSGQLNDIESLLQNKDIIILDHHKLAKNNTNDNIIHVNPHLFGIDGSQEISGAGVAYLFSEKVNKKSQALVHLAIIGAIGDIQEESGFLYLNNQILQKAVQQEAIKVKKGLKMFGIQTKPIHKVLEYSTNPNIPGVSGSESGAIQFLNQIGIDPKKGDEWKRMIDLDEKEMKRLIAGIVIKRSKESDPEDVIGPIYTLPDEEEGTPTKDAREFATLLNACGRMDRASCGIGACLGIEKDRKMALRTLADYKKEIVFALNWYEENKNSDNITKGDNYIIINAQDNVLHTIIGTLASILSKSNGLKENTYIMSLARTKKNAVKVSLRTTKTENEELDLREIVKKIVEKTGGEAGGHMRAAGALISIEKEAEFIETAKDILKKQ